MTSHRWDAVHWILPLSRLTWHSVRLVLIIYFGCWMGPAAAREWFPVEKFLLLPGISTYLRSLLITSYASYHIALDYHDYLRVKFTNQSGSVCWTADTKKLKEKEILGHTVHWDKVYCEGDVVELEQLVAVADVAHIWINQEVERGFWHSCGFLLFPHFVPQSP